MATDALFFYCSTTVWSTMACNSDIFLQQMDLLGDGNNRCVHEETTLVTGTQICSRGYLCSKTGDTKCDTPTTMVKTYYDQLQRNDPALTSLDWTFKSSNCLTKLGQALIGNTNVKKITFHRMVLTQAAAEELGKGIQQSGLEELQFEPGNVNEEPKEHGRVRRILFQRIGASVTIQRLAFANHDCSQGLPIVLSGVPNLRELKLNGFTFSTRTARSIAKCIGQSQLQKLHLEKVTPCAVLWQALSQNSNALQNIEQLELRKGLTSFLECQHVIARVRILTLRGIHLSPGDITRLAQLLQGNATLTSLTLHNCCLETTGPISPLMQALSSHPTTLETLDISNNSIDNDIDNDAEYQGEQIFAASNNSALQNIEQLEIREALPSFLECEHVLARVRILTLQGIHLTSGDVTRLAQILQGNAILTSLTLRNCCLKNTGSMSQLMRALSSRPTTLETLDLSNNDDIGYQGLQIIAAAIQNQARLVTVALVDCANDFCYFREESQLEYERRQPRVEKERNAAARALLNAVHQNAFIRHLDIRGNRFSRNVTKAVDFHTAANGFRCYLRSTDDGLAETIWCNILAKCQSTHPSFATSLIFFSLSERPTLIQHRDSRKRRRTDN